MNSVIPSFYEIRPPASGESRAFSMHGLFLGEVLGVVYPDDVASVTKRFIEYRVAAQAVLDGRLATIEFPHAVLINDLAGLADYGTHTLRADAKAFQKGKQGVGSKVLVQCINGDPNNAVIIGGARDAADATEAKDAGKGAGHHLVRRFNGVTVRIADDGSLTIERAGPTTATGDLDTNRGTDAQRGQRVVLDAEGGVTVATTVAGKTASDPRVVEQQIQLDHKAKTLSIKAKSQLAVEVTAGPIDVSVKGDATITAEGSATVTSTKGDVELAAPKGKVRAGGGADNPLVLGKELKQLLSDLLSALGKLTVGTAMGPSSPPINAAEFVALAARLDAILSRAAFTKRSP